MSTETVVAEGEICHSGQSLVAAFALGWASSDEAQVPAIPEVLARMLDARRVRVLVEHWNGKKLCDHEYENPEAGQTYGSASLSEQTITDDLSHELTMLISIQWSSASPASGTRQEAVRLASKLVKTALSCIFVQQLDRAALGSPFDQFSDKEWDICAAMQGPESEKGIADVMNCSQHTVHSHVKGIFRKTRTQSRLQVLDQLKRARGQLRRKAVESFAGIVPGTFEAPDAIGRSVRGDWAESSL